MNIPGNIINSLTEEQKKKVEAAASPEELMTIAKEYGQELTIDQMEAIAGGKGDDSICWQQCLIVCHGKCKEYGGE